MTTEERERLVREYFAAFNEGREEAFYALVAPGFEAVTRDGRLEGEAALDYLREFWRFQRDQFDVHIELQEVRHAPDGAVVALQKVTRRSAELGDMTAWPAAVIRFDGDLIVFFEGYQNREKALRDVGLGL